MNREEICDSLYDIYKTVLNTEIDKADMNLKEGLSEKLNIDSLMGLQIIVKMEQVFNILIDDDNKAIELIDSPSNSVDFILETRQGD